MPAPVATAMQQLARTKFMSFGLTVPERWQQPAGEAGDQFNNAFEPSEKVTQPAAPPLVLPASMNLYHTDAQKMHNAKIGAFIDGITSAICSGWDSWQKAATLATVTVTGPMASGGVLVGPPMMPLIMASAPKSSPMQLKYSTAVAGAFGDAWLMFTQTVKVAGLPWYPAFALFPGPMAPPTPNVPTPFATLVQVPASISTMALKGMMIGKLGDPMAPFHAQLFEAISFAIEQMYNLWKVSTMVTNVLGTGAVATFAPPVVPAGPVVGIANMPPGGLV
ncbi:MAG: hypothetical protein KA190_31675 [Kofleriaceae bacterium]|jgi:hypothetical protein|nr:hypothetical protein [Kofleriaceae bacterium]